MPVYARSQIQTRSGTVGAFRTESPQINGFAVALAEDQFGGEVLGRPAKGERAGEGRNPLGKPVVHDPQVPARTDEQVFRLQVPVRIPCAARQPEG